jgi:biotin transport system substrate-specific component
MFFTLTKPSLVNILSRAQQRFWQTVLWTLAGSLLIAISAHIAIPLKPVPLTFQSATVLLLGMVFGARLAGYMVLAYLIEGACGLPVFANFYSGLAVLTDPTIGYLVGFLPAAMLSGYLVQHGWGRNWFSTFCAAVLGAVVIFAAGVTGLACFVGWKSAFALGVAPFLVTEPIKLLVTAFIAPRFWREQKAN